MSRQHSATFWRVIDVEARPSQRNQSETSGSRAASPEKRRRLPLNHCRPGAERRVVLYMWVLRRVGRYCHSGSLIAWESSENIVNRIVSGLGNTLFC